MVGIEPRERIIQRLLEHEMRDSFLDYSMSVIVQRALPDVRDGLKPVHRRILYAMSGLGLGPARPYKKSAAVVGEVLGKYHPHGDAAVYEALVRMVQDFSLRYPLVDGQGNFGSIDGDAAAAYRYTEARLAAVALELLADIERDTVPFTDTFDAQRQEPVVLPGRLPNLLINGSSGIAVGMSTNVPPHNLSEVAAALRHLLRRPDCSVDALMKHMPGPDFPTGGQIVGHEGIRDAYRSGRGRIIMRARVQKEVRRDGREQLVVTELPYGVTRTRVVEQIADLVRSRKVDQVSDLRDESDRDGMRITIELKKGAKPKDVLRYLLRHTWLQGTFGAIMLALDHGVPREFTLKEMLERYRDHRLDVIRARSRHDLAEAQAEAHITEGLLRALDRLDAVIQTIRKARDRAAAAAALRKRFKLSEAQADAILDMRLARLTALERRQLKQRLEALRRRITELEAILADEGRQRKVLCAELDELVERYGDARRTEILDQEEKLAIPDLVAEEDWVITLSHEGFAKRIPLQLYRRRMDSGRALAGMERYEDDYLERVFMAGSHDTLLVFTADGRAHALAVLDVPEAARSSRGRALRQLLELGDVAIRSLVAVSGFDERTVLFATEKGVVKRTPLEQFANVRAGGIAAIGLQRADRVLDARLSDGSADIVLVTRTGRAIRFAEDDVPVMGRPAQGVKGIRLAAGDRLVALVLPRRGAAIAAVTERGVVARVQTDELALQKRGGLGALTVKVGRQTGPVIAARELLPGESMMVVTERGEPVRVALPAEGETAGAGVALEPGERVLHATRMSADQAQDQLELIGED
ncbi:MAG: DNA gyrase subunit A [Longimicrobiales bacterium]